MNFLNRIKELYIYFIYVSNKVITFQKKKKELKHSQVKDIIIIFIFMIKW
jgi:hypothetical protein